MNDSATVATLKVRLEVVEGTPADMQILLFGYQVLQDWCTFDDYYVEDGSIIRLVPLSAAVNPHPLTLCRNHPVLASICQRKL